MDKQILKELNTIRASLKAIEVYLEKRDQPQEETCKYLYVLECENGFYYVGHTADLDKRWKRHLKGKGSWFTRENKPVGIVFQREIGKISTSKAVVLENDLTLDYMGRYGVNKVRGGHFIQKDPKYFKHLLK